MPLGPAQAASPCFLALGQDFDFGQRALSWLGRNNFLFLFLPCEIKFLNSKLQSSLFHGVK
ncbi:hypothetical protein CO116_01660 [Candidatus Falkowbacteria bacterium CG_4_9_14_3_um_filter_38_19]|uniref:Uncharacterized protein n=2 Tax=Candidatus Falkowiibacteriota TaxID=1752728 RepID=A0A2M6WQG3_9BACT|nr:MAG: hypothetical protein COT96_02175 [Candidatus Falkowbacteria bacterium CG10_big_fil_rev_8_21_14_0_10_38_22]PJB16923.1 MAG: hypothetical protein CO116_01660 [Candidatus Falkowbacteria bacterium CG_4_9_14_3_um_filter_38_19]